MQRSHLGEFEELVLLIVASRPDEAYGVLVMNEFLEQANRKVNISAVHAALRRLEEKGYVKSSWSEASEKRGGRRKRIFSIRSKGVQALEKNRDLRIKLWNNIPGLSPNFGFS